MWQIQGAYKYRPIYRNGKKIKMVQAFANIEFISHTCTVAILAVNTIWESTLSVFPIWYSTRWIRIDLERRLTGESGFY